MKLVVRAMIFVVGLALGWALAQTAQVTKDIRDLLVQGTSDSYIVACPESNDPDWVDAACYVVPMWRAREHRDFLDRLVAEVPGYEWVRPWQLGTGDNPYIARYLTYLRDPVEDSWAWIVILTVYEHPDYALVWLVPMPEAAN
jgi:hypothetical protein